MGYTRERKESVIKKILSPHNLPIPSLAKKEGISDQTLYNWRKEVRAQGKLAPGRDNGHEGWTSSDKFAAVLETASLNEAELGEYCRKRSLYPEWIKEWRKACEQANDWDREQSKRIKDAIREEKKRIHSLERELNRKEKALAETAALLVLRKKADAIWGEPEGE